MAPQRTRRRPTRTVVVRTERLSASMVRIVLGGEGLAQFGYGGFADSYVKVMFLHPDVDYPRPLDLDAIRADFPSEHWPRVRSYTVRAWDPAALELTLDFVVHGTEGMAGPWAASAQPGDELFIQGPGGAYSPSADADWHLLVGDESALPAIAAAVDQLPADAVARIVVEVYGPADEIDLGRPVTWVHTGTAPVGQHLVETVRNVDWPTGAVQAFVHGEAGFVKALRYHLKVERGVTADQLSISGYWRLGSDDEGWRAAKAAWNAEAEAAEAAVTV